MKRVLILGGTAWLGRRLAQTALERGHEVTCLARGASGSVPEAAALIQADRARRDAYDEVAGRVWDVVVDVSRQPGQVRGAVEALAGAASFFVFVSSANVYRDHRSPGAGEHAPLLPALDGDVMETMEAYGEAKVACEGHVRRVFGPDRALIARVGLIGGPGDVSDRSGYWPLRFKRPATADGRVLVPDAADLATQVIDVRDLAGWLIDSGLRKVAGVFNATGATVPLSDHLEAARAAAGHAGAVVHVDQRWLLARGVQPWMGPRSLPLWLADPEWLGFNARDGTRARDAGLTTRPLSQTLAETLRWELGREPGRPRRAGLSDDDERSLLDAWAEAAPATRPRR